MKNFTWDNDSVICCGCCAVCKYKNSCNVYINI